MDAEIKAGHERLELLKIPVDILPPEDLGDFVYGLLSGGRPRNIVLLSLWDLLFARRNSEYRSYVQNAALVLPVSKSLVNGIHFLFKKKAPRYMPFDFVVNLLSVLEKRGHSVYLLGGNKKILIKTEKNIRQTFPNLHVVGRFSSYFKTSEEAALIEGIKKASPSLLLVGKGVRGKERWIAKHGEKLGGELRLWCSDIFEVFAEHKKRPSRAVFDSGFEWVGYYFASPAKFFRIFPYIHYKLLLAYYKFAQKKAAKKAKEQAGGQKPDKEAAQGEKPAQNGS